MTTRRLWPALFLALFATFGFFTSQLRGNSPETANESSDDSFEVKIKDAQGKERHRKSHGGRVDPALLAPNQLVEITLKFANGNAGAPIGITSLDGGQVIFSGSGSAISGDGKVRFDFQAGSTLGLYRLEVLRGDEEYHLAFYVVDPNRPGGNRPTGSP